MDLSPAGGLAAIGAAKPPCEGLELDELAGVVGEVELVAVGDQADAPLLHGQGAEEDLGGPALLTSRMPQPQTTLLSQGSQRSAEEPTTLYRP